MVKKLIKYTGVFILFMAIILIIWDQKRSFYCLSDSQCITVWKRFGNKCYIIPGKYYGIFKPSSSYVKTTNMNSVTVIWKNNNSLLIDAKKNVEAINKFSDSISIELYSKERNKNDSLYTYIENHYRKYKLKTTYLSINIEENYITDKNKGQ